MTRPSNMRVAFAVSPGICSPRPSSTWMRRRNTSRRFWTKKTSAARTKLERGLAFLALTATVGPLMGLLGTVMGMIATFKLISSFGSGYSKVLAAGISEALIATASGMIVAIPALLLHAFLSRKAKGVIGSMEQTAVGFINGIPNEEKTFM